MGLISFEQITKKFGDFTALKEVSLEIPEGKIFGFLGPNGAGKTTLIRILNRITLPTEGRVLFDGHPMTSAEAVHIGYLPEERGLYKKMKVGEQAVYLARLKGLSKSQATSELRKWFQKFEIQPWWNKKVEELSKGMAQKIQFIITVLHKPRILILDEPFSGFDPINVNLIKNEVLRLKKEGTTIILSTHNMESVEELCDEIALINKSKLIISGNVDKIRKDYGNNRVEVIYNSLESRLNTSKEEDADRASTLLGNSSLYTIVSNEPHKGDMRAVLDLQDGASSKNILGELIEKVNIISYQALMPKMNEIFISLVNQSGGATSQSMEDFRKSVNSK